MAAQQRQGSCCTGRCDCCCNMEQCAQPILAVCMVATLDGDVSEKDDQPTRHKAYIQHVCVFVFVLYVCVCVHREVLVHMARSRLSIEATQQRA